MLSPLSDGYADEIASIAATLNRLAPDAIEARPFECLAAGATLLERIAADLATA
jgi:hypothetical protein